MSALAWLEPIRRQFETLAHAWQVPMGVAVGWIQAESGGRIGEVTKLDERGYFQLLPEESKDLGIEHLRLSTDPVYSLVSGFRLVDYYSVQAHRFALATGMRVTKGTELHWRLTKLAHSIGQGATKTMMAEAAKLRLDSWNAFATYYLAHDGEYTARLRHSPLKWIRLVDRVFEIGRPFGLEDVTARAVVTLPTITIKRSA